MVGALLIDISKVFDCISYELLIAKLEEAYWVSFNELIIYT